MALKTHALRLLKPYLVGADVLSLGYPDILAEKTEIENLFGGKIEKTSRYRYERIREWKDIPDTQEVFKLAGVKSIKYVDVKQQYGVEEVCDLNIEQDLGKFDLVIDPGTLEHCFSVGTAFRNAANAVRLGGRIYHESPAAMTNHGFYNFNPTLFIDFYGQNGFEINNLVMGTVNGQSNMTLEHGKLVFAIPDRSFLICFARRVSDKPIKFPTQWKYL